VIVFIVHLVDRHIDDVITVHVGSQCETRHVVVRQRRAQDPRAEEADETVKRLLRLCRRLWHRFRRTDELAVLRDVVNHQSEQLEMFDADRKALYALIVPKGRKWMT
jgi:hypothetical protein